jgi:tetratricopeptide (TPR) repeat protein
MTAVPSSHPGDEELGRFAEGTLDPNGRARVIDHIADCDECRMIVVDSAELIETPQADRRWWLAVAAGLILVAAGAMFTYNQHRDPLVSVAQAYSQLKNRPIDARLGGFAFVPRSVTRGSGDEVDPNFYILQAKAQEVTEIEGRSPRILHAHGVALLCEGKAAESIVSLVAAATREPGNVKYQNDVAVALIAAGPRDHQKLESAVAMCDRGLQVDSRAPEPLFNRALALDLLGRSHEAIAAYDHYLAVDHSSSWAAEAGRRRDSIRSSLPPY